VQARNTQSVDVDIRELNVDGDGVARQHDRVLIVPFTIPGERVRVRLDGARPFATLLEVLEPSPFRIRPPCPHFGPCGGCAWQHIAYPEQLRLKTALVERLVRPVVADAPAVRPTLATTAREGDAAPWGYRQKVHFVFAMDEGPPSAGRVPRRSLVMGHYARGSRQVVPVQECPVHDERGNAVAFQFASSLRAAGVEAAAPAGRNGRRTPQPGVLRSIAVRVARHTSELMTTLVVRDDADKRLRTATRRALAGSDTATSLHVNLHPREDRFIFGAETRRITGHARLREEVGGTSFLMSPDAFFQTNMDAAERLVTLVCDAVPAGASVLDLYAGAGLFALPLARAGHPVVAVEENHAAVADGVASQRLNRIPEEQCRFIAQPVETALRRLAPADVIVLDPPRSGCAPIVLDWICRRPPARLVYVSCNPEALARDLTVLRQGGFRIESFQPVDMFPHTAHVETVVVMQK
jgi:23S rRNA (uracil1939-C5)-methyltransferase